MLSQRRDTQRAGISTTRLSVIILTDHHPPLRSDMAPNETFILRAALNGKLSVYREIEIEPSKSLHSLAETIVAAFGFDFDHAFGFYSGLKPATMMRTLPQYELFADMGDARPGVGGVKQTRIARAFPEIGHTMMFLFDYGDEWHFRREPESEGHKAREGPVPARDCDTR